MKKTFRFLSMAALALVGAMMTGCSNEDNVIDNPQQPENQSNLVTLTATVGLDGGAGTRALTDAGVKTFAAGDKIAVIYKNTSGETVKAVSEEISDGAGTASATFTVTLTNPDNTKAIRYIYPAAMAKETVATDATMDDAGTVDFTNLDSQEGTLADLGSKYDLCTYDATNWTSGELPTGDLENQLAILAITLKDLGGSNNITSSIVDMTLSEGSNVYTVSGLSSPSKIYVAIRPTAGATIDVTATGVTGTVTNLYGKSLSSKTYEKDNGYSVSWRMDAFEVGDVILPNGTYAKAGTTGAVAIIAYVGSLGSVDTSEGSASYKGLAIAMSDANNGSGCIFGNNNYGFCVSANSDITTALGFLDGITCTNTLTSTAHKSHSHAAAKAAASNNGNAKPTTGTSGWFLPSIGQWNLIFKGLANKAYSTTSAPNLTTTSNTSYKVGDLNAVITTCGGNDLSVKQYQSSTQAGSSDYPYNWVIDFRNGDGTCAGRKDVTVSYYVRSALAF